MVALLDSAAVPPAESVSENDLAPLLENLFPGLDHLPIEEVRQMTADEQVGYFTERAAQAGLVDPAALVASRHVFAVFQSNVQAVHQAPPPTYPGEVVLIRATRQPADSPLARDPLLGWGPYAAAVRAHDLATTHTQMMHTPGVDELTQLLRTELRRCEPR